MSTSLLSVHHCVRHLLSARGFSITATVLGGLLMATGTARAAAMADSPRERLSFNADWRFTKNDPDGTGNALRYATIKPWFMASGSEFSTNASYPRPEGNLGADVSYTQPGLDDSGWRKLNLPHDWGVDGAFINGGRRPRCFRGRASAGIANISTSRLAIRAKRFISMWTGRCPTPPSGSTANSSAAGPMVIPRSSSI